MYHAWLWDVSLQIGGDNASPKYNGAHCSQCMVLWSMMRVEAMAFSHKFHTFRALGVSAGVPSLTYGASSSTLWSCRCTKAWNSISVHPVKEVLPVSSLICYFNIPCFLSTNSAACRLYGRWNPHSRSCSFAQSCTSWPLKCDPQLLSIHWVYLYMVLSFSNPLMVAAWFEWQQRKGQMQWPHKPRHV